MRSVVCVCWVLIMRPSKHLIHLCLATSVVAFTISEALAQGVDQARAAMQRGDFATAESLYRKALAASPNSPEILTDLALTLQMQGRAGEAMSLLDRSLRIRYLPLTSALLAEEHCRTRDLQGAKPMIDRLLREQGSDVQIIGIVAPCFLDEDEPLASIQAYRLLATSSAFPDDLAYVQLAKSYVAAAQFFGSKLKETPGSDAYIAALTAARDDPSKSAEVAFSIAARNSPYFHQHAGYDEAIALWRQHPNDPALLYQMTVLTGEAVKSTFQKCSEEFADSVYFQQFRAEILADQGHLEDAISALQTLIDQHRDTSELRYTLGMLYRRNGDWDHAAAVFRDQLNADPHDERSAARLSEALLNTNHFDQMRGFLIPWATGEHPSTWAQLDLATAYQKLGNPAQAVKLLRSAETREPRNSTIHYRLMRLYNETGDTTSAKEESALFRQTHSSSQ